MRRRFILLGLLPAALLAPLGACGETADTSELDASAERPPPPANGGAFALANGCFAIDGIAPNDNVDPKSPAPKKVEPAWLASSADGTSYAFTAPTVDAGARFFLKASDLGTYLFYDADRRYLVGDDALGLRRQQKLDSDVLLLDDAYISGAEWEVAPSLSDARRFRLKNRRTQTFLARSGIFTTNEAEAAVITVTPTTGCTEHPELELDANGAITRTKWDDGALFGIVDAHSHLMTSFGFGGGGIFHGAPFHRLGVEHALADCTLFHGAGGRRDLLGFGFQSKEDGSVNLQKIMPAILTGTLSEDTHRTDGYPNFFDWPNPQLAPTHQMQYWRWIERAYLGGLRLVVQHMTTNSAMCELTVGSGAQRVRYSCSDMVGVDRELAETRNLERYIDAQSGGAGKGWFRIVDTPAQAREVISEGKLAVILGIEVSNLFDCFSTPRAGMPTCDDAYITSQLDQYRAKGIRAIFPAHKYDNVFSAGDGHRAVSELGNFVNSGQYSSFTTDCPNIAVPFDRGNLTFGGLNVPREQYFSTPPADMSHFQDSPADALVPYLDKLSAPPLEGNYCQSFGLTTQGEFLIAELMKRGMIVEIDHLPQRSYQRAYEILAANGYPAAATHGSEYGGLIYANNGISKANLGRCADPALPGSLTNGLRDRVERAKAQGGYPAQGFGFDFNGLAGGPGPRFGARANCAQVQSNPVIYPFKSYAGDVTMTEPRAGNRVFDFNTEGMAHLGMLPELVEDARRTGSTDADLEPLFRSAEGYLRMWERAESKKVQ